MSVWLHTEFIHEGVYKGSLGFFPGVTENSMEYGLYIFYLRLRDKNDHSWEAPAQLGHRCLYPGFLDIKLLLHAMQFLVPIESASQQPVLFVILPLRCQQTISGILACVPRQCIPEYRTRTTRGDGMLA